MNDEISKEDLKSLTERLKQNERVVNELTQTITSLIDLLIPLLEEEDIEIDMPPTTKPFGNMFN